MITITLDLEDLLGLKKIEETAKEVIKKANEGAAKTLRGYIVTEADKVLHSRKKAYIESIILQKEDDFYIVALDKKAAWIEDGMDQTDMVPFFMKSSKVKQGKNGKFLTIPFNLGYQKGVATTPAKADLIATVKQELASRKINYSTVERDEQGAPKLGKLHSLSIKDRPVKTQEGPNQGHRPVGAVKQGPSGRAWLDGIKIYQVKGPKGGVKRAIFTFRTVKPEHSGQMWIHPGLDGVNIFEKAADFMQKELDDNIIPKILEEISQGI